MSLSSRVAGFAWPLRRILRALSLDMVAYGPANPDWQLFTALQRRGIGITLDVGANRGQFASLIRTRGFKGIIHSFEPLEGPFAELEAMASRDDKHFAHRLALSDSAGEAEIFVGTNDQTSSLQAVGATHREGGALARAHEVAGTVRIRTERLDRFCAEQNIDPGSCFLKLDVQGHEMKTLVGAGELLDRIPLVQLELSIRPIYEGETPLGEFLAFLQRNGFRIRAIRPGYFDPDDQSIAQVDVIAERA